MSAPRTDLFLYGTLQSGRSNHGQMAGQQFLGFARTKAVYRLYQLEGYPGMVLAPAGAGLSLPGELWSVDPAGLHRLDQFEGVDEGLYRRGAVELLLPEGRTGVQTYLYLGPVTARPELVRWGPAGGELR